MEDKKNKIFYEYSCIKDNRNNKTYINKAIAMLESVIKDYDPKNGNIKTHDLGNRLTMIKHMLEEL